MPEGGCKVLDDRPHPDQETTLSCIHAQTLWVGELCLPNSLDNNRRPWSRRRARGRGIRKLQRRGSRTPWPRASRSSPIGSLPRNPGVGVQLNIFDRKHLHSEFEQLFWELVSNSYVLKDCPTVGLNGCWAPSTRSSSSKLGCFHSGRPAGALYSSPIVWRTMDAVRKIKL